MQSSQVNDTQSARIIRRAFDAVWKIELPEDREGKSNRADAGETGRDSQALKGNNMDAPEHDALQTTGVTNYATA